MDRGDQEVDREAPGARGDQEVDRDPVASRPPVRVAFGPPARVDRAMIGAPATRTIADRPTSTAADSGSGMGSPPVPPAGRLTGPAHGARVAPARGVPVVTAPAGSSCAAVPAAFAVPEPSAAATVPAVRRGRPDLVRGTTLPPIARRVPGRTVHPAPVSRGPGRTAAASAGPRDHHRIFVLCGGGRTAAAASGRPGRR